MYQNSLFPLRTIIGNAIPIAKEYNIRKVFESTESKALAINYDFSLKASIADTKTDPHYSRYLPTFDIDGTTISPGEGMDTLPLSSNPLPFGNDDQVISFFALSKKKATTDVSRKLSARFSLQLPDKFLVGGICFGGFPFLSCSQRQKLSQGENSANFGLPREVRLTCAGATTADQKDTGLSFEFLDSEISATKQDIVSHSGFQFLCIDPTLTNIVTVHFSDYPTILTKAKFDTAAKKASVTEHYGFIIPYFYVFEYKEKTRYRPVVSAGLLGTTTNNDIVHDKKHPFANSIDYKHVVPRSGRTNYFDFTAASMFGQQRTYTIRDEVYDGKKPKGKVKEEFKECFISLKVKPKKNVVLYIEQGEEYDRCVAGLKIFLPFIPELALKEDVERIRDGIREFYPDSPELAAMAYPATTSRKEMEKLLRQFLKIPRDIDFCEKIGIRVYEIDPLEGVSALNVPLDSKYATLLAEKEIDELSEISLALFLEGVKFVRPSNSRFFAIELTNLDKKPGQFVVKGMKLVQSAHVSVHPRAAKTQQIRTLNFRIIGADLAEDYSFLGKEGFNFSIERFVAGERKSVLFRANSLMDLLHSGAAKIFSNARRRAVEFEKVENYRELKQQAQDYRIKKFAGDDFTGINFENRETDNNNTSWRGIESGRDVSWDLGKGNPDFEEFETYSGTEIRSRNQQISSLLDPTFNNVNVLRQRIRSLLNTMPGIGVQNPLIDLTTASNAVFREGGQMWKPFEKFGFSTINLPTLPGYQTLNIPPFYLIMIDSLNTLLSTISRDLSQEDFDPANIASILNIQSQAFDDLLASLALSNGISLGVNTGIGIAPGAIVQAALTVAGVPVVPSLSGGASYSVNSNLTTALRTSTNGAVGSIIQSGQELKYSLNRSKNTGFDNNVTHSESNEAENKRIVTRRELLGCDRERVRGAEVMWQGELADIITGSIPLNFTLPATAGKMHFRTSDDSLRVRFGSGVGRSISVDFWFDLTEEVIRDDN